MRQDILDNNHLLIFATDEGFGSRGVDFTGHPLLDDWGLEGDMDGDGCEPPDPGERVAQGMVLGGMTRARHDRNDLLAGARPEMLYRRSNVTCDTGAAALLLTALW